MTQNNDNKRKLYDALSEEYDMGSFEQFSADLDDAGKRKKLYDATSKEYDFGDYSSFENQLGYGVDKADEPNEPNVANTASRAEDVRNSETPKLGNSDNSDYTFTEEELGIKPSGYPEGNWQQPFKREESTYNDAPLTEEQIASTVGMGERAGRITEGVSGEFSKGVTGRDFKEIKGGKDFNGLGALQGKNLLGEKFTKDIEDVTSVTAQLRSAKSELEKLKKARNVANGQDEDANHPKASTFFSAPYATRMENESEVGKYDVAIRQAEERIALLEREKARQSDNAPGFWAGTWDTVSDTRTWDFGLGGLMDAKAMLSYNEANPSEADKAMMEQLAKSQTAQGQYQDDWMYSMGSMLGHIPAFAVDIAVTGGMGGVVKTGAKIATNAAVKAFGKEFAESATKRFVKGAAENGGMKAYLKSLGAKGVAREAGADMVKALGRTYDDLATGFLTTTTVGAAKTAADVVDRKLGDVTVGENGSYKFEEPKSWADAIWQGVMSNSIEYGSERFGDQLLSWSDVGELMNAGRVGGMLSRMTGSQIGNYLGKTNAVLKKMGVHGAPGESFEEYGGQLARTVFNLDDAYIENPDGTRTNLFFDKGFNKDVTLGMLLTIGAMRATTVPFTAGAYLQQKHEVGKADKRALMAFGDDVTWQNLRDVIDATTNDKMAEVADVLANDNSLSVEQYRTAMNYMYQSMVFRGQNLAEVARVRNGEMTDEGKQTSQSYMDGYNTVDAADMRAVTMAYADSEQRLAGLNMGQWFYEGMANDPIGTLANTVLTDEERDVAVAYVNAKAALDGMSQRAVDDIDMAVEESNALIESHRNRESGMIQGAVMKTGDRKVYVVSGNVVPYADGTGVDLQASDESVVVRDADTGEVEMVSPSFILSAEDAVDAEEEKRVADAAIRKAMGEAAAAKMKGEGEEFDNGELTIDNGVRNSETPKLRNSVEEVDAPYEYQQGVPFMVSAPNGETVEATITNVERYAGSEPLYEVETDVPLKGGRRVNHFTRDELEEMRVAGEMENGKLEIENAEGGAAEDMTEEPKPIGRGVFGNIYQWVNGKAKEAAHFLRRMQGGYLKGVFHRDDIGDIDLAWGDAKGGLKHIIQKHIVEHDDFNSVEEAMGVISDVLVNGELTKQNNGAKVEKDGYRVALAKNEDGNWIVTAYDYARLPIDKNRNTNSSLSSLYTTTDTQQDAAQGVSAQTGSVSDNKDMSNSAIPQENVEVSALSRIPVGEDGSPIYEQAESADVAWDAIVEQTGGDEEISASVVESMMADKEAELKRIQKQKPKGNTIQEKIAAANAQKGAVAAAQAQVDAWKAIAGVREQRRVQSEELAKQEAAQRMAEIEAQRKAEREERKVKSEEFANALAREGRLAEESPIKQKWNAAPKVEGVANEIVLPNGDRVKGRYMLVESGGVSASHNALGGFAKTEGFPVDENGLSVNDRDYERDADAKDVTRQIAGNYDSRALQTPVVVSPDGVVLSGNGRTMAGELAAADGTDGAYVEYLRDYGSQFGFTAEQVGAMSHPRVVFVTDEAMPYTSETFAKFNQQEMKSQSKTEQAVKLGKTVDDGTFNRIVRAMGAYDTLGEFYADEAATREAVNDLQKAGVIAPAEMAGMFDGDVLSAQGREVLENMLVGKVFEGNPDAVRMITAYKSMRQSVIAAMGEISANVMLGEEYSMMEELGEAIALVYAARQAGVKQGEAASMYARQGNLFQIDEGATVADYQNATVMMLADILNDGRVTLLRKTLSLYNERAKDAAAGQIDMFSGVQSKQDIINEVNRLINGKQGREESSTGEQTTEPSEQPGDTEAESVQQDGAAGGSSEGGGEVEVKDNKLFQYFTGSLADMIARAKQSATDFVKKILAPVSSRLKKDLQDRGIELAGDFNHVIDNAAIRHILNGHGAKDEEKRGQIPITESDFARIADVVENYDEINIEEGKRGDINIIYSKTYADGTTIFVEERRKKRKELAAVSMRKMKSPALTDANRGKTMPISDLSETDSERKDSESEGNVQENEGENVNVVVEGINGERTEEEFAKTFTRRNYRSTSYTNGINSEIQYNALLAVVEHMNKFSSAEEALLHADEFANNGKFNGLDLRTLYEFFTEELGVLRNVDNNEAARIEFGDQLEENVLRRGEIEERLAEADSDLTEDERRGLEAELERLNGEYVQMRGERKTDDIRFRFIGERGAANADRAEEATTRLDNLAVAREMEADGKDAKAIKVATGWERGADGKWRYETSDIKPNEKVHLYKDANGQIVTTLGEIVIDKELFTAYPDLKNLPVVSLPRQEYGGEYMSGTLYPHIALGSRYFQPTTAERERIWEQIESGELSEKEEDILIDKYAEEVQSPEFYVFNNSQGVKVLMHEIQHAIQNIEGFARGGNTRILGGASDAEIQYAVFDELVTGRFGNNDTETIIGIINGSSAEFRKFKSEFGRSWDGFFKNLAGLYNTVGEEYFKSNYDYFVEEGKKGSSYERYKKIAGEVEARNVETRIDMTPEERRALLAEETEDVAREDQIFLQDSLNGTQNAIDAEVNKEDGGRNSETPKLGNWGDTTSRDEMRREAEEAVNGLAEQLNTEVVVLHSIDEVESAAMRRDLSDPSGRLYGWYSPKSGKVFVYLPNIRNVSEARKTVLHEVVAHKGLDALLGKDGLNEFCMRVWNDIMTGEERKKYVRYAWNEMSSRQRAKVNPALAGKDFKELDALEAAEVIANEDVQTLAAEEFVAEMAEKEESLTLWQKIVALFKDLLRKAGVNVKLRDNDVRYMLWRSRKNLEQEDYFGMAEDVVKRMAWEIGRGTYKEEGWNGVQLKNERVKELKDTNVDALSKKDVSLSSELNDNVYEQGEMGHLPGESEAVGRMDETASGDKRRSDRAAAQTGRGGSQNQSLSGDVVQRSEGGYSEREVNERFNEQLAGLTEENAQNVRLMLGTPSNILKSVGVSDKPMLLYGNKLIKKAKKHGFEVKAMQNLPRVINDPIAIFKGSVPESFAVLTEISIDGKNVLVSISVGKGNDIDFNIITSAYGKNNSSVVRWINDGKLLYADKKKTLDYLRISAPIAEAQSNQESEKTLNYLHHSALSAEALSSPRLDSAAKIVESFENPNISVENVERKDEVRMRKSGEPEMRDRAIARDVYERRVKSGLYQSVEALQDSMLGLEEGMKAILGRDFTYVEDVPDYENAYLGENSLSSVNQAEVAAMERLLFKPMFDEVARLAPDEKARGELTDYMMAKHGLERNRVMAERDAQRAFESKEGRGKSEESLDADGRNSDITDLRNSETGATDGNGKSLQDYIDEYRKKDYAGLTALTEEDNVRDAEAVAEKMVADYEAAYETDALWGAVKAVSDAILQKQFECGMMSRETFDAVSMMYDNYIPLRGFDETTSEEVYAYLSGRNGAFNAPIRTAKGRKSKADDPFANLQTMAESAVLQGNKNKLVKQRFLNFVLNHPSDLVSVNELWFEYNEVRDEWLPVYPDNISVDDSPAEVERKMIEFNERMEQLSEQDHDRYRKEADMKNVPYRVLTKGELQEHQILVSRNGRNYLLTVNGSPRLAQAVNGMTNPDNDISGTIGQMIHAVGGVNRMLSATYTTLQPDFVVSNFLRDAVYSNTMVWAKETPNYALRMNANFLKLSVPGRMKRLFEKYRKGSLDMSNETERMFKDFIDNGGETGYARLMDIEEAKKKIEKNVKAATETVPMRRALELAGEWVGEIGRAIESQARFAAFMTSRQMQRSMGRAIWDAKEISVNFNKKGAGDRFLGAKGQTSLGNAAAFASGGGRALYVFWNAALQGTFGNFGKNLKRHPAKVLGGVATMFALGLVAAMAGAGGDDDEDKYFNFPEYQRRTNFMFKLADGTWVKIPLPIEYRSVYGLGEMLGSTLYNGEEIDINKILGQMSQVLPVDMLAGQKEGDFSWLRPLLPSTIKPAYEAQNNISWTGLPIWKDNAFNKNMPEWTKAYKSANKELVNLAAVLNEASGGDKYTKGTVDFNPAKVEYLMRSYVPFVPITKQLMSLAEVAMGERDFDWRYVPLANRVVTNSGERTYDKSLNDDFFKLKNESEDVVRRLRRYEEDTKKGITDFTEQIDFIYNSSEYGRYLVYKKYAPTIEKLNKLAKDEALSDEEREEFAQALREMKKALLEEVRMIKNED